MESIIPIIAVILMLWFGLWLYILVPARMAESRNRSTVGWVLLSLIFSPILAILFLWVLGQKPA
ncbi:uncharacterized protein YqhQ [Loktanella ponticola]|uniref:Uncharacterized protein YqhQ n=1 Tax=Yoonia ponticola TaxID=1524255 RepID=A0A7W9BI35_9RHOB|nr:uncharacterized protein YqhQ [Yoonia ponticola]